MVHGGGATARFWDRVVSLLDGGVLAVDLPGRNRNTADLASITVEDEVASVLRDVDAAASEGPIVLVAHSSGGLVVPGVVEILRSRVERIVLNAALVPPEGGCGLDCMQPRHSEGLKAAVASAPPDTPIILPGPPADPERTRVAYGGDPLSDEDVAFLTDPCRFVADTVHHYFQPVRWSSAAGVPVTYVVNDDDRLIPRELQIEMLERLPPPAEAVHLPTGHVPAVTAPGLLARAINRS